MPNPKLFEFKELGSSQHPQDIKRLRWKYDLSPRIKPSEARIYAYNATIDSPRIVSTSLPFYICHEKDYEEKVRSVERRVEESRRKHGESYQHDQIPYRE